MANEMRIFSSGIITNITNIFIKFKESLKLCVE